MLRSFVFVRLLPFLVRRFLRQYYSLMFNERHELARRMYGPTSVFCHAQGNEVCAVCILFACAGRYP